MRKVFRIGIVFCAVVLVAYNPGNKTDLKFDELLVEYAVNPVNVNEPAPHFSWIPSSNDRQIQQTAYRILLASSEDLLKQDKGDVWDSGKQFSAETIHQGPEEDCLKSNQKYFWKVQLFDGNDKLHESKIASFETALLNSHKWTGKWIGNRPEDVILPAKGFLGHRSEQKELSDTINHSGKSLLLRKTARLDNSVESAKAFVTGVGFYEFYINGERVGDHVLAPAKTPYHKHILYDTYDVSGLLKRGENALGFHLGNGWYNPYKPWWQEYRMQWFGHKKAIAEIHILYDDGTREIIGTDDTWKWCDGPLLHNCVYDGEVYDANLLPREWNRTDFEDSSWKQVTVHENMDIPLVSHTMPPMRIVQTIAPVQLNVDEEGVQVFDMQQNFTGWVRLKVKGKKGTRVKIRFAEDIYENNQIDVTSNEHARAEAVYILNGEGKEVYEPAFTYFGFRYVEVTGDGQFEIADLEGRVVHTDNAEKGTFNCDNELVSKLHNATVWSQKSNMIGYPMDCPQRDERLGWFGDAQVTAEEAMYNFDMAQFYRNWFNGIRDNQHPETGDIPIISPRPYFSDEGIEWSSTYITMLWQYYLFYGDKRIIEQHYETAKRYMDYLASIADNHILPKGWIGDWGSMVKRKKGGRPESPSTAFYYYNASLMKEMAALLQKEEDEHYFSDLKAEIKIAYNENFYDEKTGNYCDSSQMSNAFPLYLGLVPEKEKERVLENLVEDIAVKNDTHLTTGVLGTKYMPEALAMHDRADIVWELINQKTYPSWNKMMDKYTTVCEFWTLKQSKNHVMMGSIDAWFYKYITGIRLDENNPAWTHFYVDPVFPEGLANAEASFQTIRGTIASSWKIKNGALALKVEVPVNTTATILLPGNEHKLPQESGSSVREVEGVEYLGFENGKHRMRVHSGKYRFTVRES